MPTYYQQAVSSFEPVAICRLFPFSFGCVVKYLFRAPFKGDEVNDLQKALDYLERVKREINEQVVSEDQLCQSVERAHELIRVCSNQQLRDFLAAYQNYELRVALEELHASITTRLRSLNAVNQ